ncbi:TonB-dependent receptor domain-containing protein [Parasphingopyxis marina]|uniref:TonB-dependent receptor n=1 Tax=Parasphingopyxis marina TaxID=2761622 RepID=A0A842I448_9SPHN|nr:TonB-dependent receptor [Parasphingopyxis marina]MBC2778914.1 TonB-dependent receptor [Parasphingopyxis marina]
MACASVLAIAATSSPALGQDIDTAGLDGEDPVDQSSSNETIIVTGTRIPGIAPIGANVLGLDRQAIDETGIPTTNDLLRSIPQIFNIGLDEARTTGAQRAIANLNGNSSVNLRGLGVEATLTLVDGRRVVPGGGEGRGFDPNTIPAIALERIEVLADGSSAIYGSDAMTGVVNLITRHNYDGVMVRGRVGVADGGVELYQAEAVVGTNWTTGNVVVAGEYYFRDRLQTLSRADLYDDSDAPSFRTFPTNIGGSNPSSGFVDANGNGFLDPGEDMGNPVYTQSNFLGTDALPEQERYSVYGYLEQEFSDRLTFFAEGFFSRRNHERLYPASTLNNGVVPANNPYNLTGVPVTVQYSFINDLGPDLRAGSEEVWEVIAGLEYDLTDDWRLSGYASYGETTNQRIRDRINNGGLTAALNSSDINTAFNPFSNGISGYPSATVKRSVLDNIEQFENLDATIGQFNAQMQADGTLFSIGGGDVRLAFGTEYQGLFREQTIQTVRPTGEILPPNISPRQEREVLSAFGELFVPVISDENGGPGARELSISLALRYDHYQDEQIAPALTLLDAGTWNPKIGIRYQPFEDLSFRATWGTSFRAPVLGDYSLGAPTVSLPTVISPGVAAANGLPAAPVYITTLIQGGHTLGLSPEEAETWTAGMEFTPDWLPGLVGSITYYNIEFTNQIQPPASQSSLNDPDYVAALVSSSENLIIPGTGLVIFNPTTDQLQQFLAFGGAATAHVGVPDPFLYGSGSAPVGPQNTAVYALIDGLSHNTGIVQTDGIDVSLQYSFDTDIGTFSIGDTFSYVFNYDQSLLSSAPLQDFLNQVDFPLRFVNRAQLGYAVEGFAANVFVNYQNGYDNTTVTPAARVESYTTFDLTVTFDTGDRPDMRALRNMRFAFSAQNLFDADPPFARVVQGAAVQNYDSQNASPLGRLLSFQITKSF